MPNLIEPGTKYFMRGALKKVHLENTQYNTFLFNFCLFLMFIILLYGILSFRKKNKLTEEEKKEKDMLKKNYLLNKVKQVSDKNKEEYDKMITELPKFESDFELLHKNFYNV